MDDIVVLPPHPRPPLSSGTLTRHLIVHPLEYLRHIRVVLFLEMTAFPALPVVI